MDISIRTRPIDNITHTSVTGAMQNKSIRYTNSEVTLSQINSKIGKNGFIRKIKPGINEVLEKRHEDDPIYSQF